MFSGEAYNVEMGITNELFPTERDETPGCQFATLPNSEANFERSRQRIPAVDGLSAIEKFALFMRFLAPPDAVRRTAPVRTAASIASGRQTVR